MSIYAGDEYYSDDVTSGMMGMEHDLEELYDAMIDGVVELECGCIVELDGSCPCGNDSPFLTMGLI